MLVPFYVIFDPLEHLSHGVLRGFRLVNRSYHSVSVDQFSEIGLGLRLWRGIYEDYDETWLRWCDQTGRVIPTGKEKSNPDCAKAEEERQRTDKLRDQLRSLGIDPCA
jgi:hypothetical protein